MAAPMDVDQLFEGSLFPDYESFEAVWNTYCGNKYVFRKKRTRSIENANKSIKNAKDHYPESWKYISLRLNCIHFGNDDSDDSASNDNTDVDTDSERSKPRRPLRSSAYIRTGCLAFIRLQGSRLKGGLTITGINLEHRGHDTNGITVAKKESSKSGHGKKPRYSREAMDAACRSVTEDGLAVIKAARLHRVPLSTLKDRLKGKRAFHEVERTVITAQEEEQLVDWIAESARRGIYRTMNHVRRAVQTLLNERGAVTKFKNNLPGVCWVNLFLQRHPEVVAKTIEDLKDLEDQRATTRVDASTFETRKTATGVNACTSKTQTRIAGVGTSTSETQTPIVGVETSSSSSDSEGIGVKRLRSSASFAISKTVADDEIEPYTVKRNSSISTVQMAAGVAETAEMKKVEEGTMEMPDDWSELDVDPLSDPPSPSISPHMSHPPSPLPSPSSSAPQIVNAVCISTTNLTSSHATYSSPAITPISHPSSTHTTRSAPTKELVDRLLELTAKVGLEGLICYRTQLLLGLEPNNCEERLFRMLYSKLIAYLQHDNSEPAMEEQTTDATSLSSHCPKKRRQTLSSPKTTTHRIATVDAEVTNFDGDNEKGKRNKKEEEKRTAERLERKRSEEGLKMRRSDKEIEMKRIETGMEKKLPEEEKVKEKKKPEKEIRKIRRKAAKRKRQTLQPHKRFFKESFVSRCPTESETKMKNRIEDSRDRQKRKREEDEKQMQEKKKRRQEEMKAEKEKQLTALRIKMNTDKPMNSLDGASSNDDETECEIESDSPMRKREENEKQVREKEMRRQDEMKAKKENQRTALRIKMNTDKPMNSLNGASSNDDETECEIESDNPERKREENEKQVREKEMRRQEEFKAKIEKQRSALRIKLNTKKPMNGLNGDTSNDDETECELESDSPNFSMSE